jgi:hypothetical protein
MSPSDRPGRGRPKLPKGEARQRLGSPRVAPRTLRYLEAIAGQCGGIGQAIDHACDIAAQQADAPSKPTPPTQ